MKIHEGGTVVYNYRSDGTVQVYRERWYHKVRTWFFTALFNLGLWR